MIRIIAAFIFLLVFLIISIPLIGVDCLIRLFSKEASDMMALVVVTWAFRVLWFISGIKLEVNGEENIPDEAVLFVSNHRSIFDIVILYGYLGKKKRLTGFVAKKETRNLPVIGWWMRLLHCRFLDRKDIRQGMQVILECIEEVKNGICIVIYPEGTRGKSEDETQIAPFREGSLKIAVKAGSKIVPVAMSNTRAIFEEHLPFLKGNRVRMTFGQAIDVKDYSKDEQKHLGEMTRTRIEEILKSSPRGVER
ncbi:MAG: 1-acyl-sn-glycerol-3-phosphate acyltransferase [Lachnospiraceae bacterium]|nr:1-acyl-sn-glycerol-3-phosphate acyltransferase [Lachnospiraceae bacterium]